MSRQSPQWTHCLMTERCSSIGTAGLIGPAMGGVWGAGWSSTAISGSGYRFRRDSTREPGPPPISTVALAGEDDDRDAAGRLGLVLGEEGILPDDVGPEALVLGALGRGRPGLESLRADLDGDVRVRHEVVVPVRVARCPDIRWDHEQTVRQAPVR